MHAAPHGLCSRRMRAPGRLSVLFLLATSAACARDDAPGEVRFVPVTVAHTDRDLVVEDPSPAFARARLVDDLDRLAHAPAVQGRGPWRTVAVVRPGELPATAARERRTYALLGGGTLKLDVRVGAGKLGGFAGSVVATGALRAMAQIRIEDRDTPRARFRLSMLLDDGPGGRPARDALPRYLSRALPAGMYRASFDVPARGGRVLVGVTVEDAGGTAVSHAWASPIAIERPWQ